MVNSLYNDLPRRKFSPSISRPSLFRPLLVITASILVSIASIVFNRFQSTANVSASPLTTAKITAPPLPDQKVLWVTSKPGPTRKELVQNVKDELEKSVGTYSVYVYDFDSDEGYGLNEHTVFVAASITKVPILTALYLLAQEGKVDLEKTVTIQRKDIQDYGTGILRYQGAGKPYSLKTLAQLMMEKSDNTAAYILATQVIGYPSLNRFIKDWQLEQTDMVENTTVNFDMAQLFIKLHQEELVKKPYLAEMFDFMKDTDFEERIPANLPDGTTVYHKTGDQVSVSHDIGIVDLPRHPYYVGIMTSNMLVAESAVKETMARVSRIIYDYQISL